VLSKQNEVTAFKACGVSLHRLACRCSSEARCFAGLFLFDFYWLPGRTEGRTRCATKSRARHANLSASDRKWIMGYGSRIYYYRYFDTTEKVMEG